MKKILFTVLLFIFTSSVYANEINSISVDMYIDEYGNANITEVWDMNITEGTEVYKPLGNLGTSEITNFKVSLNGRTFTYKDPWNVNASFNEKAYKNGISSDNELCFGMSKKGHNKYTLTYDMSNVIYNVEDAQFLYYKFINDKMDPAPRHIEFRIKSFYSFPDTLEVWSYGYKGYSYAKDGIVQASNENDFDSSMYGVILVKFPVNTFITDNFTSSYSTFSDVLNKAKEGTFDYDYSDYGYSSSETTFFDIMVSIFSIIAWIVPFLIVFGIGKAIKGKNYQRKKISLKDVNNFRDIPCNKDIYCAYFLSQVYNMGKERSDFLGALLLKWLRDGQIKLIQKNDKKIIGTKENTSFDLTKDLVTDNKYEEEMYNILRSASGDNILEAKELEKWCNRNYSKYFNWFDKVFSYKLNEYKDSNQILDDMVDGKMKKHVCSSSLHEEAVHLLGLKKFLLEFSSMDKREIKEVHLWQEYLMFAQILGIADKVAKQLKKLYPELTELSDNNFDLNTVIFINSVVDRSYYVASSARSAARSAADSYSSGGGGFSSGGGGGGSFGGGSGGGCR